MAELKKGARITGGIATSWLLTSSVVTRGGSSIRDLASETGRSYGFVHRMLSEAGVTLRGRGGATRGKKA